MAVLQFGKIDQGAAGTTELVAAQAGKEIRVISYVVILDATGTFKFNDGVDDLTGAIPVNQYGGALAPTTALASAYSLHPPHFVCGVGRALQITSTGGGAHGHFSYHVV